MRRTMRNVTVSSGVWDLSEDPQRRRVLELKVFKLIPCKVRNLPSGFVTLTTQPAQSLLILAKADGTRWLGSPLSIKVKV